MSTSVAVSVSVNPSTIAAGRASRITIVLNEAAGPSGRTVAIRFQTHPTAPGARLLDAPPDTVHVPAGRMNASVDVRTTESSGGGAVAIVVDDDGHSVSTTLTISDAA
jgi:hypothetical protein